MFEKLHTWLNQFCMRVVDTYQLEMQKSEIEVYWNGASVAGQTNEPETSFVDGFCLVHS